MSDINIYDISIGVYTATLTTLVNILKKAALQPDAASFPSAKLADDMLPLTFQVRSVSTTVSRSLKWLIGSDIELWDESKTTTMEELIAQTEKTLAFLKSFDPKTLEGKETALIKLPTGEVTGKQWIFGFGMPNIFFHLQTAYAILRMKGVPIGKGDYLMPWNAPWNHSSESNSSATYPIAPPRPA